MAASNLQPAASPRAKRPSVVSLVVWGIIGLVVGVIIGGLAIKVSGALGVGGTTVNVRVEIFGLTVRQGVGPEPMDRVVWTRGAGLLAVFSLAGTGLAVAGRVAASRLLWSVESESSPA